MELEFIPPKNTFFSWDKIKRILNHYNIDEQKFIIDNIDHLDRATAIQKLAVKSPLFPDNGHPSRECFEQLANKIIEMVSHARQS